MKQMVLDRIAVNGDDFFRQAEKQMHWPVTASGNAENFVFLVYIQR